MSEETVSHKKWRVRGSIRVGIDMLVEAADEESAIEAAYQHWPGMSNYVGNGKSGGAMCGPCQDETDANIEADYAEPEFDEAELENE